MHRGGDDSEDAWEQVLVRLDRTHLDLRLADPAAGDTVAAVASRWGFTNPGRFATQHRRLFGETPSATLRR